MQQAFSSRISVHLRGKREERASASVAQAFSSLRRSFVDVVKGWNLSDSGIIVMNAMNVVTFKSCSIRGLEK